MKNLKECFMTNLESFIVGKGIFYMIYLEGDEDYTNMTIVNGELFVSEYDYTYNV